MSIRKNVIIISFIMFLLVSCSNKNSEPELTRTPPMGWNSFDSYGCAIYEEIVMKEVKVFIEQFAPHGYEYFVIDNGWFSNSQTVKHDGLKLPISQHASPENVTINEYGIVQPSDTFFPNGFSSIVEKLHSNGLKFGLHIMRGIPRKAVQQNTPIKGTKYNARDIYTTKDDCGWCKYMHGVDMNKPGSQEYYNNLVAQFAAWGVDFIKVDHVTHKPAEIEAYVKAIENCNRDIVLSLSAGGTSNKKYCDIYRKSNMVRITKDIWDDEKSLSASFSEWRAWQGLEKPGFWPDLDMIPFGELNILKRPYNKSIAEKQLAGSNLRFGGKMHHWCNFTEAEKETFITQRALAASPLIIGGSLVSMDDHSQALLTNKYMIECNQNGIMGKLIYENNGFEIWHTPIKNDDEYGWQSFDTNKGWLGIFNRTDKKRTFTISKRKLPVNESNYFYDIWNDRQVAVDQELTLLIAANGVIFIEYR